MKIAVDITQLARDQRGMGFFTSGFLEAWKTIHPEGIELLPVRKGDDLADCRALWAPFNLTSIATSLPTILTIHDLTPFIFPLGENRLQKRYKKAAERAAHIIVSSKSTEHDVKEYLNLNPEKISLAYLGFDPNFKLENDAMERPEKYILAIGNSEPRKNFDGLIRAFAIAKAKGLPEKLALIGENPPWPSRIGPWIIWKKNPLPRLAESLQIESDVLFLGSMAKRSTVLTWYKQASLVVVPSFYEGFGYPVLETYACGVPLACSRAASLPEVAGDAAFYFDPHNEHEMADVMAEALSNRAEVERKKKIAVEQLARFNWRNCIHRYAEIFRCVLR